MKTILSLLLLICLGAAAQPPPSPPPASTATNLAPRFPTAGGGPVAVPRSIPPTAAPGTPIPAPPNAVPPAASATAAPVVPAAPAPAAPPAPGVPVTPPAPIAPPAPAANPVSPAPVAPPQAQPAQEQTIPPGFWNWTGAELNQILQIYAEMVGRSILRGAALPAPQIVFKNQTELTRTEAIQALDAILAMNSIAMVNIGEKFVKAVPLPQAGTAGGAIRTNDASELPDLGGYQTHVVQLKYIRPSEVMPVIQPFASAGIAPPIAIESSQMLVIRDNSENVKRMLEMIEKVDVSIPSEFVSEVIPIKFAKVADIASALGSLSGGGGGTTAIGSHSGGATGARGMGTGARTGGFGQPGYNNPNQPMSTGGIGAQTGTPSSTTSFSDRLRNIISRAASPTGSGDFQIIGPNKIVADERSNSLLVFASRQDMNMITNIIGKLDVVLAQVLIETVILDVALDDSWNLGISAIQTPKQFGNDFTGAGGMNANRFFNFAGAGATNSIDQLVGSGFKYFGKVDDNYYVSLEAAASDGRVNVVQKPRIQTSHATPASLFIGNTVPYVTSTYYGGGYAGGPSSAYQQLRVGIGLNVTPFINQDGLVVMQVDEQIEEISGSTEITGVGKVPNTTSRTISAEVAVRDGESIILGGFIRNAENKSKSGVPILKDIPLLGNLFSSRSDQKQRLELIVLMRPTVLRTPELAAAQVAKEKRSFPGILQAEREYEKYQRQVEKKSPEAGSFTEDETGARQSQSQKSKLQNQPSPNSANQKSQQDDFNQTRPFTPEEQKLFGNPAPANP